MRSDEPRIKDGATIEVIVEDPLEEIKVAYHYHAFASATHPFSRPETVKRRRALQEAVWQMEFVGSPGIGRDAGRGANLDCTP